jgi:hypothetical protein
MQIGSTNTSTINIGVSGDTVNIPSGVTIANAGTATGFGGVNTPFVMVGKTSTTNISDNTWTTVVFDNELYDANSVYNNSTGACTPTAGTYHIFSHVGIGNSSDDAVSDMGIKILIGGSTVLAENTNYNVDVQRLTVSTNAIYTFDGSTNFVIQAYSNVTSGTPNIDGVSATRWGTFMGMYKIIT